jgi:hypothetical protein
MVRRIDAMLRCDALSQARCACVAASSPLEAYNTALCLRALTDSADVARALYMSACMHFTS